MAEKERFTTVRPNNVGPHHVNKDQTDPEAPKAKPEEMYNNEIGGQVAAVDPSRGDKEAGGTGRK